MLLRPRPPKREVQVRTTSVRERSWRVLQLPIRVTLPDCALSLRVKAGVFPDVALRCRCLFRSMAKANCKNAWPRQQAKRCRLGA